MDSIVISYDVDVILPNDILREIFAVSDVYTQAAMRSCSKATYAYEYINKFEVYSANLTGIHIAYNTSRKDRVRYHCVGDIQIWTLHGELPSNIVAWYTCDRVIVRNKKTRFVYKDLLFDSNKKGEHKQVNLNDDAVIIWHYTYDESGMPSDHVKKIYTLSTNPIVHISLRITTKTGECVLCDV